MAMRSEIRKTLQGYRKRLVAELKALSLEVEQV
jgi:hypothetical protein